MRLITLDELIAHQNGESAVNLVDVRLEDEFKVCRIPGSKNACVLNVSFLADLAKLGCLPDQPIVVYGENAESHESRVAAEKLQRAGFADIQEFRGGLSAWKTAEKPVEGDGSGSVTAPVNGTFSLNLEESRVEWLGRNLLNKHFGTIALKSGHVTCTDGRLVGGDFVVDMNAMSCSDIDDSKMSQILVNHLKSDDFFDVERHTEARFQIRQVEAVPGATRGLPNARISGELSLRGQFNPLVLFAVTGFDAEGRFAAQTAFAFDRTTWGSIYGSGKFFKNVGMHLVNDLIEVQVRLLA